MQARSSRRPQTPARHLFRLLAVFCLLSAGCAPIWAEDLAGTYEGKAPAADASRRVFTLQLAQDGTAIFDTLYLGKGDTTQRGRWTKNGSEVILTFDAMGPNRPPRPITFRHHGHLLSPIHWDPSEWGRKGPPVLRWTRATQAPHAQ